MAINPETTTTVKVSELASAGFNTTDLVPHEVGGYLKKGTLQDLATFIGGIISTEGSVAFKAVHITDGQTLPATTSEEFILVGPGTYPNVGGGSPITTTEALNALVSNGTYWYIGVEIPITASGTWGAIAGELSDQTDLQDALDLKADLVGGKVPSSQLPSYVDDVVEVANYAALPATGETGKIYITIDNNKVYRWSGSAYIEIAADKATWGLIDGTLSNQTDLQNALNGKFNNPTGDTTQYIAGNGSLITFPTSGEAATLVRQVRNTTGATLTKGTVVYISGATGNKPTVSKAIATGDSTSAQTFGLVQADISNNSNGNVVCVGDIIGLDTSAISEGTQLYLSSTTAGAYTTTKQLAPAHLVYIGVVTRSHATLGQIEVKIQNGYELDELHDVAISSKTNNQVLAYESSTDLWKNKSINTILGYTPANANNVVDLSSNQVIQGLKEFNVVRPVLGMNLSLRISDISTSGEDNGMIRLYDNTIFNDLFVLESDGRVFAKSFIKKDGTSSQYLMADGSVSTGGGVSGSGTTNYIPKFTGSTAIGNSLIYDNGTNVGIGTTSPSEKLSVIGGNISLGAGYKLQYSSTAYMTPENNVSGAEIATGGILTIKTGGTTERVRVDSSGNVGIGTTSPAVKFHSYGGALSVGDESSYSARFSNNSNKGVLIGYDSTNNKGHIGSINPAVAWTDLILNANGGNVGIGTTSPSTKLDVTGAITASGGFFNSDMRLKELTDYDYNVSDIKPISYFWKDGRDDKKHVGYSAQEVKKVMPDAVNEGTDGMLSVNYVEVLVAKIAELESRIKQLEK